MQVLVFVFAFLGSSFAGYLSKTNEAFGSSPLSSSTSFRGSQSIASVSYGNTGGNVAISQPKLLSKTSGVSLSSSSSAPLKGLARSTSLANDDSFESVGSSVTYGAVRSAVPVGGSVSYSTIPVAQPLPTYSYKSYSYPTYGSSFYVNQPFPVGRNYQSITYGQQYAGNVLYNQRPIGRTYLTSYPSSYSSYISSVPLVNTVPVWYPVSQTYPLVSRGQSSTTLLSSSVPLTPARTTTFTSNSGFLSQPLQTSQQEFDSDRDEPQQPFVDTEPIQQNQFAQQEVAQPEPQQFAAPAPIKTGTSFLSQKPLQPAVLKN